MAQAIISTTVVYNDDTQWSALADALITVQVTCHGGRRGIISTQSLDLPVKDAGVLAVQLAAALTKAREAVVA